MSSFKDELQEQSTVSLLLALGDPQFIILALAIFACLLSKSGVVSSAFFLSQTCRLLKTPVSSCTGCKSIKISPSHFPVNGFGEAFSLCVSLYFFSPFLSRSLSLFLTLFFFLTRAPFPLKCPQSISPPNNISTLPTFLNVASSLPLAV